MKHLDVASAVVLKDGKILAMRRGPEKNPATSMKWEFPGGKVEPGETPAQTVERELMEEMSYEVHPIRRLVKVDQDYPGFSITLDAWLCSADSFDFIRKEHIDSRWIPLEELSADVLDWAPADRKIVAAILPILR